MQRFIAYVRSRLLAPAIMFSTVLSLGACAPLLDGIALDLFEDSETAPAVSNYEKGKAEFVGGHMGLAVLHFQAALVEHPESVEALNGLGAACDQLGRFDLSARAYTRALDLAPDNVQTLNNLGYSYLLQGRHDLAVAYLRAAAVLSDGDARIRANRILAEDALAQAGGPSRGGHGTSSPAGASDAPLGPYLVRGGKAVKHLVTQGRAGADDILRGPNGRPNPALSSARQSRHDGLPDYAAAPMAIGGRSAESPNLKAMRPGF
jgi:tetratricopeptide (TPR) repeat protein